jgi:hypothetical protein
LSKPTLVKQARVLLSVTWHDGSIKVPVVANGGGVSNDSAEAACWREIKRIVKERYPGARFRVRALWYEIVEDNRPRDAIGRVIRSGSKPGAYTDSVAVA